MKLSEMIEYTASMYLDDRTDLVDGDPDSIWSDAFLVIQFNEAQRKLARDAWCIIENGVAPVGRIVLRTGVSLYPYHKSILRVFDATPSTQVSPLGRSEDIQLRNTNTIGGGPTEAFDAVEIGTAASLAGNTTNTAGPPLAFASDAGTREIRVFPPPTSDENGLVVALKVARLPITWLTLDDTDAAPEVPEDYHVQLCEFAAGKALTLPNVDGEFRTLGRELLEKFETACKDARRDRQRAEAGPSRWTFASTTAVLGRG